MNLDLDSGTYTTYSQPFNVSQIRVCVVSLVVVMVSGLVLAQVPITLGVLKLFLKMHYNVTHQNHHYYLFAIRDSGHKTH